MLKIVNLCVTDKEKMKFLFLKRNKPPFSGYFGMMGGKVEKNESENDAASRELFEESGINSTGDFLGKCHEKIIENDSVIGEFEIYFYHFIVDETTEFNPSEEGDIKWINKEEFEETKLIPSDPLMIDTFFNKKAREVESIIKKNGDEYLQERFETVENRKVGVGVGVMIFSDEKILLGKRHEDNNVSKSIMGGEGSWTMPGGKLEYGESFEEAAIRETQEECGIILNNIKVMCVNNDKSEKSQFVTLGLFSDDFTGKEKVMEPDKITEWKWFSLDNLPEKLYLPTRKMIQNYRQNKYYIEDNK